MDKEKFESYSKFIAEPGIDGLKMLDELRGTLLLQDFDPALWPEMMKPLDEATQKIPFVSEAIIKPAEKDAEGRGVAKIDRIFQAVQVCTHPLLSPLLAEGFKIDNDALIVAATHNGIVELSEIYQTVEDSEKQKVILYALYFAAIQAKVLGFRTTSTFLALDLKDDANLRFENISVIAKVDDEAELKKAQAGAIFDGRKVTEIRRIGKDGKFFVA